MYVEFRGQDDSVQELCTFMCVYSLVCQIGPFEMKAGLSKRVAQAGAGIINTHAL